MFRLYDECCQKISPWIFVTHGGSSDISASSPMISVDALTPVVGRKLDSILDEPPSTIYIVEVFDHKHKHQDPKVM